MSEPSGRLAGRLALVTGASRGIGAAVARRFAAEGAHVILLARTVGGLEELDDEIRAGGGTATLVPLDLRDFDKLDQMGASLYQRFGRLDVLVANAGVLGTLSPMGHFTPKIWAEVIDTNLTANWRLIRSLDPLLRLSESGRAIFTTCAAARDATPYWGAYVACRAFPAKTDRSSGRQRTWSSPSSRWRPPSARCTVRSSTPRQLPGARSWNSTSMSSAARSLSRLRMRSSSPTPRA